MEAAFRQRDRLDGLDFQKHGDRFGSSPSVNHLIAHADPALEQKFTGIITAASKLQSGALDPMAVQMEMKAIQSLLPMGDLLPAAGITAEEGKAIGQQMLNTVVRMRAGDMGDAPDMKPFLTILQTKGAEPMKEKGAQQRISTEKQFAQTVHHAVERLLGMAPAHVAETLSTAFHGAKPSEDGQSYAQSGTLVPETAPLLAAKYRSKGY
jgi:hypothetical protein